MTIPREEEEDKVKTIVENKSDKIVYKNLKTKRAYSDFHRNMPYIN